MIVKVMQRRSGKTTELIKYSHHTGIPIVVSNIARVSIIKHMAKRMELDIPEPLTSNTVFFRHGMAGLKDRRILIDDLDAVISELFRSAGAQPELATLSWHQSLPIPENLDCYHESVLSQIVEQ